MLEPDSSLRLFIGIPPAKSVENHLESILARLRPKSRDVKWVPAENIHLTLKFLGTIEESMVISITDVLQKASGNYRTFTLTLSGVGVFPNVRSPRVVWVGMNESSVLTELQADIEDGLASLGFEREKRKYTAHLTLGRFKSSRGKSILKEKIETYRERVTGSFDVGTISLMKSDLGPSGAKYTRVAEARLGKERN
jgi:2'-5' RNA ligase